jgi:hypothetical protein
MDHWHCYFGNDYFIHHGYNNECTRKKLEAQLKKVEAQKKILNNRNQELARDQEAFRQKKTAILVSNWNRQMVDRCMDRGN